MSYRYNPFGRRTHKTVDGEETHYLLDGDHVIAEYNDAGKLARRYVYGAGIDQPILWSYFFWLGDYSYRSDQYYHRDALGSVIATSGSETGRLAQTHTYSPYGLPDEFGVVAGGNPYLYTGREYDSETGLYYYRNRYYDPQRGRFLQPDPIGYQAGMNLYAYVDGNPITWADPLGLDKMFQGASIGHLDPTTIGASFRHGLGITLEGAFPGIISASLELQMVEESGISLPGGFTHEAKQQAVFKIKAFGYEGAWGSERSVDVDPTVYFDGQVADEAWARLRAQPWTTHPGGKYTGNLPTKGKIKVGGTIWIGGSLLAEIDLLKKVEERERH